jgi:transcriptional regulator with XRE-family HTH domain
MKAQRPQNRYIGFRAEIRELGISQAELGRQLGVSAFSVSRWERSVPLPQYVRAYIDVLTKLKDANRIIKLLTEPK